MRRLLKSSLVFAAALSFGQIREASAQRFGRCQQGWNVEQVNQNFRGNSVLHLRRLLDLSRNCRGYRISQVFVEASSAQGRGTARLEVDGRSTFDVQQLNRFPRIYTFDLPRRNDEFGTELRTLQIRLNGNISVRRVGAYIQRDRDRFGRGLPDEGDGL